MIFIRGEECRLIYLLSVLLAASAAVDLRTKKIPNCLLLCGLVWILLLGIPLSAKDGFSALFQAVTAFFQAACFLIFLFPLFSLRLVGAGDLKLVSILVFAVGFRRGIRILFLGLFLAAVPSFAMMCRQIKSCLITWPLWHFSPERCFRRKIALSPFFAAGLALAGILENAGVLQEVF